MKDFIYDEIVSMKLNILISSVSGSNSFSDKLFD